MVKGPLDVQEDCDVIFIVLKGFFNPIDELGQSSVSASIEAKAMLVGGDFMRVDAIQVELSLNDFF